MKGNRTLTSLIQDRDKLVKDHQLRLNLYNNAIGSLLKLDSMPPLFQAKDMGKVALITKTEAKHNKSHVFTKKFRTLCKNNINCPRKGKEFFSKTSRASFCSKYCSSHFNYVTKIRPKLVKDPNSQAGARGPNVPKRDKGTVLLAGAPR